MRLALLALLVACAEEPKKVVEAPPPPPPPVVVEPPPKPRVPLWTDADAKQLADAALARIAENQQLACTAPPLGKPVDGTSTAEVLALVTDSTPCLKQITALNSQAWHDKTAEAVAIDKQCGDEVAKLVVHAAAYKGGCSPFIVGIRVEPERLSPIFNLAWELVVHTKTAKDVPALLAGIRVMEDVGRGRVSLLTAMISSAGVGMLAKRLDELVETAKFSKAEAAATTKALSALAEGAPSYGEVLVGEHQAQALALALPLIEPAGWTPPGGPRANMSRPSGGEHPIELGAATLEGIAKAAAGDLATCPPAMAIRPCYTGIVDAEAARKPQPEIERDLWKHGVRATIIDMLAGPLYATGRYAEKLMNAYEALATVGSKLGLKGL